MSAPPPKRISDSRRWQFGSPQIRQDSAHRHLALYFVGSKAHAHCNSLALAQLILQDAQSLVQRVHKEIGNTIADCLLLCVAVSRHNQGPCACNVGCGDQRAALFIQLSGIKQFAAEAVFAIRKRRSDQPAVGLFNLSCELICGRC